MGNNISNLGPYLGRLPHNLRTFPFIGKYISIHDYHMIILARKNGFKNNAEKRDFLWDYKIHDSISYYYKMNYVLLIDCLRTQYDVGYHVRDSIHAANGSSLETMIYIHEKGYKFHDSIPKEVRGPNIIDILELFVKNGGSIPKNITSLISFDLNASRYFIEKGYNYNASTYNSAIKNGNTALLDYLDNLNCPKYHMVCIPAIEGNHFDLFIKYFESNFPYDTDELDEMGECAAEYGRIEILKYLLSKGYILTELTFKYALYNDDNIEMIKYLHEMNCPKSEKFTIHAVYYYNINNLKFLHEKMGYKFDSNHYKYVLKRRRKTYDYDDKYHCATLDNRIYTYLHKVVGCQITTEIFVAILQHCDYRFMKYALRNQKIEMSPEYYEIFIENYKRLDESENLSAGGEYFEKYIDLLLEYKCPLPEHCIKKICKYGSLQSASSLKYYGFDVGKYVYKYIAKYDDRCMEDFFECFPFPVTHQLFKYIIKYDKPTKLQIVLENSEETYPGLLEYALSKERTHIAKILLDNNYY